MEKEKMDFQKLLIEIYANLTIEEKEYSLGQLYNLVERFPENVRDEYIAILDEQRRLIEEEKNKQQSNSFRK